MTPAENRIFYRRMFELALPIGLQHLMLASVAAADAMMLGRVAQAEMEKGTVRLCGISFISCCVMEDWCQSSFLSPASSFRAY